MSDAQKLVTDQLRFIDLFAGLGGFHLALSKLGHKCVFASELDATLATLYEHNFGIKPHGDIRLVPPRSIPPHDILCAGFPCQPFSKAGDQKGFQCPQWGDLFDYIVRILRSRRPQFFIIENVPNLIRHEKGKTWSRILRRLTEAGYHVDDAILSPHHFGVPQVRPRAFIVGSRRPLEGFSWPIPKPLTDLSIKSVLDTHPGNARPLSERAVKCLEIWQEFLDKFPIAIELPSFPIWAMEFGATYPFKGETPYKRSFKNLSGYRGAFGSYLGVKNWRDIEARLPPYARSRTRRFPKWKEEFIRQNRELYIRNKGWIDKWKDKIAEFPPSFQKLEWNCKGEPRDVWRYVLQFRASGIRVKRPTTAPSLVAMTTSQVPVIAWERRYMTMTECARLQRMDELNMPAESKGATYKALGNAVNVTVVKEVASKLFGSATTKRKMRA